MVARNHHLNYAKYHDLLRSAVTLYTTLGSYFLWNKREVGISRRWRKLHVKYIDLIWLILPFQGHAEINSLPN